MSYVPNPSPYTFPKPFPAVSRNLFPLCPNEPDHNHRLTGAVAWARLWQETDWFGTDIQVRETFKAVRYARPIVPGPADRLCIAQAVALASVIVHTRNLRLGLL